MKFLKYLFLAAVLLASNAYGQEGFFPRDNCDDLTAPVNLKTWCFNRSDGKLYGRFSDVWVDLTTTGSGTGAPTGAAYITQTPNATLTAEQALSLLATGILKVTTATGEVAIAVAGDFPTLNQNTTGNATTATALSANPANCSSGQAPHGVTAAGAAEDCFDVATQAELDLRVVIAAGDPTENDDDGDGYVVGTQWFNTTDDRIFIAEDVSTGAADWKQVYPGVSSTPNLTTVMGAGNTYYGADCTAEKAIRWGKDSNLEMWECADEAEGLRRFPVVNGVPDAANKIIWIRDGFVHEIRNRTTGALLATVNSDGTVLYENLKTTGAATGKKVVCVDETTGQLFTSSTGVDCSN